MSPQKFQEECIEIEKWLRVKLGTEVHSWLELIQNAKEAKLISPEAALALDQLRQARNEVVSSLIPASPDKVRTLENAKECLGLKYE